jgi:hypothetical protein
MKSLQLFLAATAISVSVSGCGGGSSYMAPAINTTPVVSAGGAASNTETATSSAALPDYSRSTGISGTVGIPAPASVGATPLSAQLATPGGPTLDSIRPPSSVSFPGLTSILQSGMSGLTAVSTNEGASVVLNSQLTGWTVQLVVPAANLNRTFSFNGSGPFNAGGHLSNYPYDYGEATFGLSYVALGGWGQWGWDGTQQLDKPLGTFGVFAFGYQTPQNAIPLSGKATFDGVTLGTVFTPIGTDIRATDVIADAAFSVDFGSGKITGALAQSHYLGVGGWVPWNDVSVSASIAAGTNRFSGATAVTSAPQGAFVLNSSATGSITGGFYGPAAENLGAIWTLSDGITTAVGGVAAGR